MKHLQRFCTLLFACALLAVFAPSALAAGGSIEMRLGSNTMSVNGAPAAIDPDAAIMPQVHTVDGKGYTMLPLRAVVESMGGTVDYDAATKIITMTYNGTTMTHQIGTSHAQVDGAGRPLAIASYAANNRTYVHLRAIELLDPGITVEWSASDRDRIGITWYRDEATPPVVILPSEPGEEPVFLNLTVYNEMDGVKLTELRLVPVGAEGDLGNLLSKVQNPGTERDFDLTIIPGEYDLIGVDADDEEYVWHALELGDEEALYLWLIEDENYELTDDEDYKWTGSGRKPDDEGDKTGGNTGSSGLPEGFYLGNETDTDFDRFYVINGADLDGKNYGYSFGEPADYFEEHGQYQPSDFYVDHRNFEDGDVIFFDAWNAGELKGSTLYFKGVCGKVTYYGELRVRSTRSFDYNFCAEIEMDDGGIEGGLVEFDLEKAPGNNSKPVDPAEQKVRIFNGTGRTIDRVELSIDGGAYQKLHVSDIPHMGYGDLNLSLDEFNYVTVCAKLYFEGDTACYYTNSDSTRSVKSWKELALIFDITDKPDRDFELRISGTI